ncbi:glycosyltransferase family 4 protein, partial [Chryseobacterium gleum]
KYIKYIKAIYPIVPASADFLNQVYDVPYKDMKLLPLGCDYLKSIDIMERTDTSTIKSRFGIKENDFVLITGGKFDPLKKTDVLINAVEQINDQNIHLIVFGKASDQNLEYENMLKDIAKKSNVHFTGWLDGDSILELMTICDVAIYPASQSVIWQQSIGMHLPLLIGDSGGQNPEYLNLYNNIIILKSNEITSENMIKHITHLKSNPELLQEMKSGAKKVASEYLDYRIICNTTLEVFEH